MNSSCGPILNWISENSKHSVHVPPNNDVITYFDNNQVLARNWRVHFDAKAILSAIITIIHAFPFHPCNVQFHPGLSPRSDIGCIKKISVSHGNCISLFPRTSESFRTLRENFISERLSIITKEQKYELTGYSDNFSTIVSRRKTKM